MAQQRIHVLSRQCAREKDSHARDRPAWFDREACFRRLLGTADDDTRVRVALDTRGEAGRPHFAREHWCEVHEIDGGSDSRAYLQLTHLFRRLYDAGQIRPSDVVYVCEDDYLHLPGWPRLLREGVALFDYVSLYDHPDKYPGVPTGVDHVIAAVPALRVSASSHWRTACSTTSTFACLASTLAADLGVHRHFCTEAHKVDHEQYLTLWLRGRTLGTCVPARATHCMAAHLAPVVDWQAAAAAAD